MRNGKNKRSKFAIVYDTHSNMPIPPTASVHISEKKETVHSKVVSVVKPNN